MDYNKAWEENEKMLEEKFNCSIRDLREISENIQNYGTKFSTREIYGNSCFSQITHKICEAEATKLLIVEWCIKRNHELMNLDYKSVGKAYWLSKNETLELKDKLLKAKALWNILEHGILPLEVFWAMEYLLEDGATLTEEEREMFDYMKKVALTYIESTEELIAYLPHFKSQSINID